MHYKAHHVTPVIDHPFNLHECTITGITLYKNIKKPTGSEEKKKIRVCGTWFHRQKRAFKCLEILQSANFSETYFQDLDP